MELRINRVRIKRSRPVLLLQPANGVLREGNAFSRVCLSTREIPVTITMIPCTSVYSSHIRPGTPSPASDIWWPSLGTYSNLFTGGPLPPEWHPVVATEARMVCKRAVRILLDCVIVLPSALNQPQTAVQYHWNNVSCIPMCAPSFLSDWGT